jgi:integrase/recombinase XerD
MTTEAITPLRQRMIEDMTARKLNPHTQRSHISSCKRFAGWLKRSPDTATPDEVRRFQLHLIESGASIGNRNRIMTGVRFLFRVTLRRHDLAAEVWHLKEPEKIAVVMSADEIKRLLAMASSLKTRVLLSLGYGCGLRAGEIVRLKVKHIDTAQSIIRIEQGKGGKDRNVMLSPEMLDLLRQWWRARPPRDNAGAALSRALHPSGGNLQPPPDLPRRQWRYLQMEGLPHRRPRALQADDARSPRVHPPLPDARLAGGLPPNPLLWIP